jgi:hypothetical protein
MTRTRTILGLCVCLAGLTPGLRADTLEMIGGNFIWSETGTWQNRSGPDHPPGPGDTARFDFDTFGYNFFLDVDASCEAVNHNAGAATWISLPPGTPNLLSVGGTFSVSGAQSILQLQSLDLDVDGNLHVKEGAQMFTGGVNISVLQKLWLSLSLPASLSVGGGSLTVGGDTYAGGPLNDATLSMFNATVNLDSLYVPLANDPASSPTGQVNVTNGTQLTTGPVFVGFFEGLPSDGEILVSGPGTLFDPGTSAVEVGSAAAATGSIILDDQARMERPALSDTFIRPTGTMDIANGAELNLAGTLTIDDGTLTSTGGGLQMVGAQPEVRVENRGLMSLSGSFTFGSLTDPPTSPYISVSGGSAAQIEDHWRMGSTAGSSAQMDITGLATFSTRSRLVGMTPTSDLFIGDVGSADLEVRDGGLVEDFRDIIVGNLAGSSGTLLVSGVSSSTRSKVQADAGLWVGGGPGTGTAGAVGTMTVADGGDLDADTVVLAAQVGSQAALTIGDPPPGPSEFTTVFVNNFVLLGGGTAELIVWSNAFVRAAGPVQVLPGSVVSMRGGQLVSDDLIVIGTSAGSCEPGDTGAVVMGHGTLNAFQDTVYVCGRMRPGGFPDDVTEPALIDVVGDYWLGGVLEVELGGTNSGVDYGQVEVFGNALLGSCTVEVTLAEEYVPTPGSTYDVLVASNVNLDEFAIVQFDLPPDMVGTVLADRIRISAIGPCPADLDGNGEVDIVDFLNLLNQWGTDPGGPPDLDGNGDVDVVDFLALLSAWGPCP